MHLGPVIHGDDKEQLKATARYGARAPLTLSRLTYNRQKQEIAYTYTNPYDTCEYTEKVTPHELIARLMTHIPDPWEHTTRNYGFYSNRTRGKRKRDHGNRERAGEEKEARAPMHWRRKWAELLRLVFEVNLACPRSEKSLRLNKSGLSNETIARHVGVNGKTVAKVLRWIKDNSSF